MYDIILLAANDRDSAEISKARSELSRHFFRHEWVQGVKS